MPENLLDELVKGMREAAVEAGTFMLNERKGFDLKSIEYKGHNDLVSYVDKTAEKIIIKHLKALLPEAGYIAEEGTETTRGERYNWIIDPLDGTTNFIHGLPFYCVSIALMEKEDVIAGVIYEPNLNECFYAHKESKAYCNDKEIRVSPADTLSESLIATGFPYTNFSLMKEYMDVFDHCMRNTRGLRRLGSAALDMAYVACGRFESFYEYGLNPWDIAAGCIIVERAGGQISDFSGEKNYIFGKEILSSNTLIHNEFLTVIRSKFKK